MAGHVARIRETKMLAGYRWEIRKEIDSLEDLGVMEFYYMVLQRILRKYKGRPSTEVVKLMTGTSDLVMTRRKNVRLLKT
jgi:hypothetical protein